MKKETQIEITNTVNVWQVGMVHGNAFEFRQDIYFSIANRRFKVDVLGLRHFDFLSNPIIYN